MYKKNEHILILEEYWWIQVVCLNLLKKLKKIKDGSQNWLKDGKAHIWIFEYVQQCWLDTNIWIFMHEKFDILILHFALM